MTHPTNFRSSTRLALGLAGLLLLAHTQAQAQCVTPLQTFGYTGSIDSYSVPSTGDYWLEAAGAEGGNQPSSTYRPGRGAIVGGKFHLTAGTSLNVLVGEQPSLAPSGGNGGGGGSFVVLAGTNPPQALVVGGGGAGSARMDSSDKHGQATPSGAPGGHQVVPVAAQAVAVVWLRATPVQAAVACWAMVPTGRGLAPRGGSPLSMAALVEQV